MTPSDPERRKTVVERLKKLLSLATSTNPHESAMAKKMAEDLMKSEAITPDEISGNTPSDIVEHVVEGISFGSTWRIALLTAVAMRYDCRTLFVFEGQSTRGIIVGKLAAANTIERLFRSLHEQLKSRYTAHLSKIGYYQLLPAERERLIARFLSAYCYGAVLTLQDRLLKAREDIEIADEPPSSSTAPTLPSSAAVSGKRSAVSDQRPETSLTVKTPIRDIEKHVKTRANAPFRDSTPSDYLNWSVLETVSYRSGKREAQEIRLSTRMPETSPRNDVNGLKINHTR